MSTIGEIYNETSDIYDSVDYDDYEKNTDALILVLSMTTSRGVGNVTCTDPLLRENNGNIFVPSSISQSESDDSIKCKDVLYSYRNTIREFNKFIDIFEKRRTVSSDPNVNVQTVQLNSVNIQADELNCCVSAVVDRERYGDCTDNIRQTSDISVKITDVEIDEFERAFMIQKINDALYQDFENAVSRSTCLSEAEKQGIISSTDMDVEITLEMKSQFVRVSQVNEQNYYIKYLWSWGPCFDINQSNKLDIDINLNKDIVSNITRDVFTQFVSRNPNFIEIMKFDNEYLTTDCSPDCNQDSQNPRCGGDVCDGKTDGDTCPGGGVCDGGVCREAGVCEGKLDGMTCPGGVCEGGECVDNGPGDGGGGGGETKSSGGKTTMIVVGALLGGVVLIALVIYLYFLFTRKRGGVGDSGIGIYF